MLALVPILFVAVPATASNLVVGTVIDNFDDAPQRTNLDFFVAPPTISASTVALGSNANIIGGERELSLEVTANPGLQASVNVLPIIGGVLNVNNGAGVVSVAEVVWDGVGTGSLMADLTRGGIDDLFAFELINVDQIAAVSFTVTDLDGDIATLTRSGLGAGTQLLEFNDFSNFSATDFSSVKSIRMAISGPEGVDLNMDFFGAGRVVPSPTSATAMASLIAVGWVASFRRRRVCN